MRVLAVSLVLLVPLLSGCLGGDDKETPTATPLPLALTEIRVPDGATLTVDPVIGAILEWKDVVLPFKQEITIPTGATIVSLQGEMANDLTVRAYLSDNETGRRRCNPDALDAWNIAATVRTHTCSGMAAIDPPGTVWKVDVTGPATGSAKAAAVRVSYDSRPIDGLVAALDLTQLSMPTYDLEATTGEYVASFDDVQMWVEVTIPKGDGPFPTIIGSSPYNGQVGRLGQPNGKPAMWEYFTHDWAKRGYAIVNADVRGYGLSGGCVEVWSEKEQKDQAFLVDWVAQQAWSDGNVGFYGQSYVATTPVAAAVQAPEALKAIIAVAPVINSYEDWHYGGVPNGESYLSPAAYQVLTDMLGTNSPDPTDVPTNAVKGICDPTLTARANDPRAIYDDFYIERDFKIRAGAVKAAVLYTQGFEDSNVKSAMIPGWFNEVTAPKLGLFGHWVHQHPTRADEEILFLGWMDQYVKGRPLGFEDLPEAEIATNVGTVRQTGSWPTVGLDETLLWPDLAAGTMSTDEGAKQGAVLTVSPAGVEGSRLVAEYEVPEDLAVSGVPSLHVRGTLDTKGNAFLNAELWDISENTSALVSYGAINLAHEKGHDSWNAVTGASDIQLTFIPTEHVFQKGHTLRILVSGNEDPFALPAIGNPVGRFTFGAHPDGMGALHLPTVPMGDFVAMPRTAMP